MAGLVASSRFGGGQQQQQQGGQKAELENQIVNTVKQDMEAVDKLGQWVYSCYSPAKDCASVPGMDDICPEELRLEAYQAKAAGTVDQYTARVKGLQETYQGKRNLLKNPDAGVRQTLVKIYNKVSSIFVFYYRKTYILIQSCRKA